METSQNILLGLVIPVVILMLFVGFAKCLRILGTFCLFCAFLFWGGFWAGVAFGILYYIHRSIKTAQARQDALLRNMFPVSAKDMGL